MTSVLRNILHASSDKTEYHDDDYSLEYSFAIEYTGPQVSHEIPQVVPVDVRQIPTASIAAKNVMLSNLSLPVIQPIAKRSVHSNKDLSSNVVYSNHQESDHVLDGVGVGVVSTSSSSTLGFYDDHNNSNQLSESSTEIMPCEDDDEEEIEEVGEELPSRGQRMPVVTFRNVPDSNSDDSDNEEHSFYPEKPMMVLDSKNGTCYRCKRRNRFSGKENCIVCGAKYCDKCVIRAMGSMPEGRKCLTCIGYRVHESKRGTLGKCSGMLKGLVGNEAIKQIMSTEIMCKVNQLHPKLIVVNDKPLSVEELVMLQSCASPPKKLKPGKYWYDKVSGFWGKYGEKPFQIISADLQVGYAIRENCSNGNTNVLINGREITKPELWMLQAAGVHCEGNPHFWLTPDGYCQLEGMNNVTGKLWDKKIVKAVCAALSLPFPSDITNPRDGVGKDTSKVNSKSSEQNRMNKLLLLGCDQSGTSTIFKQAKFLYNVPFLEDEKQNIKFMIQRNLYSYLAILLEANERFAAEENMTKMNRLVSECTSGTSDQIEEESIYSISPRLKNFSTLLLEALMSGHLEAIFPVATREYAPSVEELWKDKGFQATYERRNELNTLPKVAQHFLEQAVEISRMDYEPSQTDILYAGGLAPSNGVACTEFYFPMLPQQEYMETSTSDQNDSSTSYQLIRVHENNLGQNCKWLEMFEEVDLIIYCVSLAEYDEYHEDITGVLTNKMLATKKHFESIVNHPTLANKDFLLVLNKYDLLEEKIDRVPLTRCDWFQDFSPVISHNSNNVNSNNPPMAQRAFHYIAVQFKKLFNDLTRGRKLYVSKVSGLEADSVDKALRYGKEVLKWDDEKRVTNSNEYSTESVEPSTSGYQL